MTKTKARAWRTWAWLVFALAVFSSASGQIIFGSSFEADELISLSTVIVTPMVVSPPGSSVSPAEVTVRSLFSGEAEVETAAETLLVAEFADGGTFLVGFGSVTDRAPIISIESTAEALILMMTGVGREAALRDDIRQRIRNFPSYQGLIADMVGASVGAPTFLDRLAEYPAIVGTLQAIAAQAIRESLEQPALEQRAGPQPKAPVESDKTFASFSPWNRRQPWDWYGRADFVNVWGQGFLAVPSNDPRRSELVASANPRLTVMAMQLYDDRANLIDWRVVPRSSSVFSIFPGAKNLNSGAAYREFALGSGFPRETAHVEFHNYWSLLTTETENGRLQIAALNLLNAGSAAIAIFSQAASDGVNKFSTLLTQSPDLTAYAKCIGLGFATGGTDFGVAIGTSDNDGVRLLLSSATELYNLLFQACFQEAARLVGQEYLQQLLERAAAAASETVARASNPIGWFFVAITAVNQTGPFLVSYFTPGFQGYRLTWFEENGERVYISDVVPNNTRPSAIAPIVPAFTVEALGNRSFRFDASSTASGAGPTYSWTFGDAGFGSGELIQYTYAAGGFFDVTLEVSDANSTERLTRTLQVPDGSAPEIESLTCSTEASPAGQVAMTARVVDIDSDLDRLEWRLRGSQVAAEVTTAANEQTATLQYSSTQNSYYPELTAIDARGNAATAACIARPDPAAPVANDDAATVIAGGNVRIAVLDNDQDSDGVLVPATLTIVQPPSSGTVTVDFVGGVTYQTALDSEGLVSFSYSVQDNDGLASNQATVVVAIEGEPPEGLFRDCDQCPLMIEIPGGAFMMGDIAGSGMPGERPVHEVVVPAFAAGVYEVTWDEWEACVAEGGCTDAGPVIGIGNVGTRGTGPLFNVNWNETQEFVEWLSLRTGESYRLLTEAEWEYVARAGSSTRFWWGDQNPAACATGAVDGANYSFCATDLTVPVGSYEANDFGLYDVHGNVYEWVEDCYNLGYIGAPTDGSAWLTGSCGFRILRGGSWGNSASDLRSASRALSPPSTRSPGFGFRVARDLER